MANMRLDSSQVLCKDIDDCLLGWLASKDRNEEKKRLDRIMCRYLGMVTHHEKFQHREVTEIIRHSTTKEDFSGRRAAKAFEAVANYAANLLCYPWRQEFYEIKLYCGYYKHEIDEALSNAYRLFELMGYQRSGHSLKLRGVVDPDLAKAVCRDAIMAQAECTIMQRIYDDSPKNSVTWGRICSHREEFVSDYAAAARHLLGLDRERRYQERRGEDCPRLTTYAESYPMHPQVAYAQRAMIPCQRYAAPSHVLPPYAQHYPSYTADHHVLKPQDLYPLYPSHQPHMPHNGYPFMQNSPQYCIPTTVPTGKLIEVDSSPVHHPYSYPMVPEPICTTEIPSSKAKNDGAGSWEHWDELYKVSGYCKNVKEATQDNLPLSSTLRGMSLAQPTAPRIDNERNKGMRSSEFEDIVPRSTNNERTTVLSQLNHQSGDLGITEAVKLSPPKVEAGRDETDYISYVPVIDNNGDWTDFTKDNQVREKEKSPVVSKNRVSPRKSPVQLEKEKSPVTPAQPRVVTLDVSPSFAREASPIVVELPPEKKWECSFCTFLNDERKNVCEMCKKSRIRDEIKPTPSGGRQCPQCTLVNKPSQNFCTACNFNLKGSPTYV